MPAWLACSAPVAAWLEVTSADICVRFVSEIADDRGLRSHGVLQTRHRRSAANGVCAFAINAWSGMLDDAARRSRRERTVDC